ncbi:unnamed protein product [Ectocarpus sp. 6 AP-2014]
MRRRGTVAVWMLESVLSLKRTGGYSTSIERGEIRLCIGRRPALRGEEAGVYPRQGESLLLLLLLLLLPLRLYRPTLRGPVAGLMHPVVAWGDRHPTGRPAGRFTTQQH